MCLQIDVLSKELDAAKAIITANALDKKATTHRIKDLESEADTFKAWKADEDRHIAELYAEIRSLKRELNR